MEAEAPDPLAHAVALAAAGLLTAPADDIEAAERDRADARHSREVSGLLRGWRARC